jgi:hypothetical protein
LVSTAGTLHALLKRGSGPVPRWLVRKKELDDISFSPGYSTGRHTFFQVAIGLVLVVSIYHLGSLGLPDADQSSEQIEKFVSAHLASRGIVGNRLKANCYG